MAKVEVDALGNCPRCLLDVGTNPGCENCRALWDGANTCPCCDEPLLADQPWRRRLDGDGYVHAWCDGRLN